MNKNILFCGNGLSGEILKDVKGWGYSIFMITEFTNDKGLEHCNEVIEANSKDVASALDAAKKLADKGCLFHGVISLCWDTAKSVAAIASHFGLQSISNASATLATDKDLRSKVFEKEGVPAPRFKVCSCLEEVKDFANLIHYPIVLKPLNLSSSKGVILIKNERELENGYNYVKHFGSVEKIIANEFILGSEHSTEGLMIKGKLHLTAISDRIFKYKEYEPNFVEVGDIMPTSLDGVMQDALTLQTEKAALALGIYNGVVKGDIIISTSGNVYVIELAARLGGPRFGTEMVPLSNGTCILKAAIQQSMGEEIDLSLLAPKFSKGMVNRSIFPVPGVIIKVDGVEKIKTKEGYYDFKWWSDELTVGDVIPPYEHGCGNVAYFIASGDTRGAAIANADNIEAELIFVTENK